MKEGGEEEIGQLVLVCCLPGLVWATQTGLSFLFSCAQTFACLLAAVLKAKRRDGHCGCTATTTTSRVKATISDKEEQCLITCTWSPGCCQPTTHLLGTCTCVNIER
jgi:hypothetical protein